MLNKALSALIDQTKKSIDCVNIGNKAKKVTDNKVTGQNHKDNTLKLNY